MNGLFDKKLNVQEIALQKISGDNLHSVTGM